MISIPNHEIVLRPILFSVYTVELYAIQLRDISVTKRQGPVHPDDQLKFCDLLFFCLFLCQITLLQSQYRHYISVILYELYTGPGCWKAD